MEKVHSRINWENYPSIATPLNEANLNKMDKALDEVDNRVLGLDTAKLDKSTANTMVKDVTFDESTGIFTVTLLNGTAKTIDTKLEKVVTNFRYDNQSQKLVLTLADGSEQQVDLSSLISNYEFADGNIITFIIGSDGKVTANVKDGSITETKLQPNFLANVKTEVSKAKSYADSSYENATTSRNAVTEAKQYRDEALQFRNEAESFAPEGYADLVEQVQENTVKVDTIIAKADLGIKETASGEDIRLIDSAEGKAVEFALYGKAKQNTTSGKNLLESKATSQTLNGVTFTVNEDKSISVSGTATETMYKEINNFCVLSKGDYIISSNNNDNVNTYFVYIKDSSGTTIGRSYANNGKFSLSENDTCSVTIKVSNGTKLETTFYPMIRLASITDDTYEPYSGGMASPNPQYPQPIEVSGASYNLLENKATSQTINGVEFVVNEDKSITANGTATANLNFIISELPNLPNEKLILSGCKGGSANTYSLSYTNYTDKAYFDVGNGIEISKFDYTSYPNSKVQIEIKAGTTFNNVVFYPMIRKASVTNDRYMPYGKGSVEVKSCGKNLLKNTATSTTMDNVEFVVNNDKSISTNGITEKLSNIAIGKFKFKKNKKYILSGCPKGGSEYKYRLDVRLDKRTLYGENLFDYGNGVEIVTNEDIELLITLRYSTGTDLTNLTFYPMIRLATDTDPTYEPYKETLATIPTENGLASVNDVRDVIVKYVDGSGERIQRVAPFNFEDKYFMQNYQSTSNPYVYYCNFANAKDLITQDSKFMCEECRFVEWTEFKNSSKPFEMTVDPNPWIRFNLDREDYTLEEFKALIQSWTFYATLVTPIRTPLTAEEIAEIEKLHTFYPVTNISNDFDCGMSVTYYCDSKNYIDNKIALLTTAMVNNI